MTDEELKSLVASLAAEGKETDKRLKENAEQMKETDKLLKENAEQMKKTDEQMKENAEQMKKTDEQMKKTDEQMKETDLKIAKLFEKMGGIDDNIGYHAEQFFQNVFTDNKVFGGIVYNDIILNMKHSEEIEFDIFLRNGNSVALIEVKNRIHPNFVKKLAKERMSKFRKFFPEYNGYKVYLGIAGFSFSKPVLAEAKKYGVGIIRQVGNGVEIDATGLKAYKLEDKVR